ncbi:MAG TPA: TonB-dependent receptor plug domain-containing protein [Opitutaceae bacterium]|nr:TonB-dependent receptor plug domain-containing protein [Opitutaceae bacterium]
MNTPHPRLLASALLLTLGLPAGLLAQTAAPAVPPSDEGTVTMSPFTVSTSRDNGYIAVDSLAGGRQAAPLRVTPAAISSMTREFIDDLSLTNVQDALRWSLNTVPTSWRNGLSGASGGDVFNFWSVSIRGDSHVQGGNPPTKNYFPTFMGIDTYNIDRIETDSGPNSILFGIGDIGGSLTAYTKMARFDKDFSNFQFLSSNYGGYRVTADVNQAIGNLALRVNAVTANEKGWKDGDNNKKNGVDLAGTWKIGDRTQVRFEIEGWKQQKTVFAQSIQDGVSLWNGTTNSATWGSAIANSGQNPASVSGAPGVTAMSAWGGPQNYYVWTPSTGLMNWAGGARSMGTGDVAWGAYLRPTAFNYGPTGGTKIPALPSRHFAVTPADGLLKPEALMMTLNIDHTINANSEFEISGYRYVDDAKAKNFEGAGGGQGVGVAVDLNKQLPNGQPNPNYGKPFSDFFLDAQTQDHWVNEVRGQYSYHFDARPFNIPLKQLFSVSAGEQVTEYDARQYQATVMNNYDPNNWTQSMIWGRVYWDAPQRALNVPNTVNGQTIRYIPLPFNWYDFNSKQTIKYGGIFAQTRLWNDRLNISLGARRDSYDNWKVGLRGTSNPPTIASGSGNTYSAGFVGYVTDWLGIVGNLSDNYQPAAGGLAPSLYGAVFGPSFGKGKSAGLRVSTKDHNYYASLTWYNDTSHDIIGGDSPDFQGLWNDYFDAGGTVTKIGPAGTVTGGPGTYHANMSYADTYDVKYTGVEFEATANPTRNIRLQVHYSKPKGEKENDGPNAARYFAENLATWQTVAGGTAPASTKLASAITTAQNQIKAVATSTITGHLVKSMFNVFGVYTFTNDALRGFEVGGGATSLGEQYGQPWDTVNGQRTLSPSYTTYSALVAYSRTFDVMNRRVHAKFQVNVDNLFGKDSLIFLNYQGYGTNQTTGMDYNLLAPRKITFSARFEF